jgi:methanobactin biosynthesis cassette protein MbnC
MGGSAAEWAILDRTSRVGIVLASSEIPQLVIGWKCRRLDSGREIETVELEEPLPPPPDGWGYFTLDAFDLSHFPGWLPVPR